MKYNFEKFISKRHETYHETTDVVVSNTQLIFISLPGPYVSIYIDKENKAVAFKFTKTYKKGLYKPHKVREDRYNITSPKIIQSLKEIAGTGQFKYKKEGDYFVLVRSTSSEAIAKKNQFEKQKSWAPHRKKEV